MKNGKRTLAILGLLAATAFAGPALAQDSGWYAGFHLGQSDIKEIDETDTAWKILGGYQFNRSFAAELGYTNLGDVTITDPSGFVSLKATAFELVGVGSLPVADRFSIYGKLGLYRAETEVSFSVAGFGSGSGEESNNDITFGFGIRYDVARNIGLRAEWQRYADVGDATDVDVLSIGVVFKFQ